MLVEHLFEMSLDAPLLDCVLVAGVNEEVLGQASPQVTKRLNDFFKGQRRRRQAFRSAFNLLPNLGAGLTNRALRRGGPGAQPQHRGTRLQDAKRLQRSE